MIYTNIPILMNSDNSLSINTRNLKIYQGDYDMYQLGLETNIDYSALESHVNLRVSFRRADGMETPYLNFTHISGKRYYLNLKNRWFTNVAGNLYITIQAYNYTQEEVINILYSGNCTLAILPVASFNPIEDILPTALDVFMLEVQEALDTKLNKNFTGYGEDLSITGDELVAVNNADGSIKTIRTNLLLDTVRTVNNIQPDANKNITITGDNIEVSGTDSTNVSSKLNTNTQNIQTNINNISTINNNIDVIDNRLDNNDTSITNLNTEVSNLDSELNASVFFDITGEEDDVTMAVAERAYADGLGNNIVSTYATKAELSRIINVISAPVVVGDGSRVSINLPENWSTSDVVLIEYSDGANTYSKSFDLSRNYYYLNDSVTTLNSERLSYTQFYTYIDITLLSNALQFENNGKLFIKDIIFDSVNRTETLGTWAMGNSQYTITSVLLIKGGN